MSVTVGDHPPITPPVSSAYPYIEVSRIMEEPTLTIRRAAEIAGKSPRRIQMKARAGGDEPGRQYPLSWFPADWQPALLEWWQGQQPERDEAIAPSPVTPASSPLIAEVAQALTESEDFSEVHCKSELIHALDAFVAECTSKGVAATHCWQRFREAYNRGEISVSPATLQHYPPGQCPAQSTILGWRTKKNRGGLEALLSNQGSRNGKGLIRSNPQIREAVDGAINYVGIHATAKQVWKLLQTYTQVPDAKRVSRGMVQRYLDHLRKEEPVYWLTLTDPKAARNKVAVAFGSRSSGLQPCDLVEIDFTRNDIVLAGPSGERKRYALGMAVDVATRRCQILISEVPKGEAAALLILKCLEKWGQIKTLRSDNGKEFINQRVKGLCAALSIYMDLCVPGKPMEKPHVERLIGTFNHDLITLLPSYVGKSVAERQAIRESRGEKETLELALEFGAFQQWADLWVKDYETRYHSSLNCSPLERLAQFTAEGWVKTPIAASKETLAVLALPRKKCMVLRGDGVRLLNRKYLAPELSQWIGLQVMVLYDPGEPMRVRIFSLDMKQFICEATWDTCLTAEEMAELAAKAKTLQKALTKGVSGAKKEARKICQEVQQNAEKLVGEKPEVLAFERVAEATTLAIAQAMEEPSQTVTGGNVISLHGRRKETAVPEVVEPEGIKPAAETLKELPLPEKALKRRFQEIEAQIIMADVRGENEPLKAVSQEDFEFFLGRWRQWRGATSLPDAIEAEIDRLSGLGMSANG